MSQCAAASLIIGGVNHAEQWLSACLRRYFQALGLYKAFAYAKALKTQISGARERQPLGIAFCDAFRYC